MCKIDKKATACFVYNAESYEIHKKPLTMPSSYDIMIMLKMIQQGCRGDPEPELCHLKWVRCDPDSSYAL